MFHLGNQMFCIAMFPGSRKRGEEKWVDSRKGSLKSDNGPKGWDLPMEISRISILGRPVLEHLAVGRSHRKITLQYWQFGPIQ